jgi:hypothetical protein
MCFATFGPHDPTSVHRRADYGRLVKILIRLIAALVCTVCLIMAIATFMLSAAKMASLMRSAIA